MPKTIEVDTVPVMFTKGQSVTCTICKDETAVTAEAVYDYLWEMRKNKAPIPFENNCTMGVEITDIAVSYKKDPEKGSIFSVVVEGVLV